MPTRRGQKFCKTSCRVSHSRKNTYNRNPVIIPPSIKNETPSPKEPVLNTASITKPKKYNYDDMPKGLTYVQQTIWKQKAREDQDKKVNK